MQAGVQLGLSQRRVPGRACELENDVLVGQRRWRVGENAGLGGCAGNHVQDANRAAAVQDAVLIGVVGGEAGGNGGQRRHGGGVAAHRLHLGAVQQDRAAEDLQVVGAYLVEADGEVCGRLGRRRRKESVAFIGGIKSRRTQEEAGLKKQEDTRLALGARGGN